MNKEYRKCRKLSLISASLITLLITASVNGQSLSNVFLEEIVITATKKKNVENVQDVPAAISAFGEAQLDALKIRDISGLSYSTPNVALDDIGTAKGTANFSVRGLGVNSSIPSIDPAVGVFVDGVYYGINAGVIFDTFDLDSVEILRGPQGVLFGRNVTGGAVVLNTADASFEQSTKFKAAAESGFRGTGGNFYLMGSTTGTLVKDKLAGKLAVYYNDDQGWFENTLADGSTVDFGANDTFIFRPSVTWTPNESTTITVKYEHGEYSAEDGVPAQSHINGSGIPGQIRNFDRNDFDFSVNENGFNESEWDNFVTEANIDVDFGNGRITNIFGYRQYSSLVLSDIDASSSRIFDAEFGVEQEQFSNELRYNGQFGEWNVTTGLFYFEQDLDYSEVRFLLQDFFESIGGSTSVRPGGGVLDQSTLGLFVQAEYQVNDKLTLSGGLRYSDEEKEVQVASVLPGIQADTSCRVTAGNCIFDFSEVTNPGQTRFTTDNFSPKFGFNYVLNETNRFYGSWTRAFRAGGYNFRNTAADTVNFGPGPFEDEQVDSFELGWKSEPTESSRLNISVFNTEIEDLQREINRSDPVAGVVQVIRNTANATIFGVEVDGQVALSDRFLLTGSIGVLDGDYDDLFSDLTGDGVIDGTDFGLAIPRLADLTYNLGLIYEHDLGDLGIATFQLNFSHRDETAYTDNNLGIQNENDRVDANIALVQSNGLTFSLYGKNLTDEVNHGNDTQLPLNLGPAALGGTFAPLAKGRVIGLEVQGSF